MALCPNCGAQVETDFGMVLCPACSAAIFFDMDGNPHLGVHQTDETVYQASPVPEPEMPFTAIDPDAVYEMPVPAVGYPVGPEVSDVAEPSLDLNLAPVEEFVPAEVYSPTEEFVPVEEPLVTEEVAPIEEVQFVEAPQLESLEVDFEQTLDQSLEQSRNTQLQENDAMVPSFKEELIEHGNSVEVGQLTYSLVISGLDTGEMKNKISAILSEPKFGFDAKELKGQIKDGVLHLDTLNAVKASVLVSKLKSLQVEISWSQNVE